MKALIFKEFKLAMHPICYIFIIVFPFMILIPNYPLSITFIYILATYPILFLGANKGQQSNDLLFSTLMPVRKKDIVLARLITVSFIQIFSILLASLLLPLANLISSNIANDVAQTPGAVAPSVPGLTRNGFLSIIGFVLAGYALSDLIFFPIYYKKGKSIVASSILTILFFTVFILVFTLILPLVNGMESYKGYLCDNGILPQLLVFGIGVIIYIGIHYLVYKIASRNLEKVDF